jgi:hypothetical protein
LAYPDIFCGFSDGLGFQAICNTANPFHTRRTVEWATELSLFGFARRPQLGRARPRSTPLFPDAVSGSSAGSRLSCPDGGSDVTIFERKWKYQSYRPAPGSAAADPAAPAFVRWSPPGVLIVDAGGATGTLEFPGTPVRLPLTIRFTPGTPAGLAVTAVLPLPGGKSFTNELHGWFVPADLGRPAGADNPLVVRGSIVQTSADVDPADPQPAYTTGFFVLEPLPALT